MQAVTEKASIDEVYMDVTAMVDEEMRARSTAPLQSVDSFAWGSIVLGGGPLAVHNEFDRRLAVGACIACRLRGTVFDKLGECSRHLASLRQLLGCSLEVCWLRAYVWHIMLLLMTDAVGRILHHPLADAFLKSGSATAD